MPKPRNIESEVTYSQPFAAIIKKDGLIPRLVIGSKKFFQHQLGKFKDGERVTLQLTNMKPKRTLQQNAYYWGAYLPLIAEQTGENDIDHLHELFKGKFLTKEIVEVLGEKVRIKGSTTKLSKGEFSNFITSIQLLTGIEPPPTENYGLESLSDMKETTIGDEE
jgi:hypothetical protein